MPIRWLADCVPHWESGFGAFDPMTGVARIHIQRIHGQCFIHHPELNGRVLADQVFRPV
jgi:hypothetical protein